MKRSVVLLLAGALAAGALAAQAGWEAGAAKVAITPTEPIWLAGYGGRTKPSSGVLQNIYVKALALRDETGTVSVVVTSDLVGLSRSMVDTIVQRVRETHHVPRERLILNYSHNHSCPVTADVLFLYYDLDAEQKAAVSRYTAKLLDQYVEVVGKAIGNLAPATLGFEQGLAGFAVNRRRSRPGGRQLYGPVDHDVPVLSVRAPDGRLRAVLFGYACHNTALGGDLVNGDYAGWAQETLENTYPGGVALFLMGCGADSNPLPRYQGRNPELAHYSVELATMYGKILAAAVDLVLHGPMKPVSGPLQTAAGTAEIGFQKGPSREELVERLKQTKAPMVRREIEYLLGLLERDGKLPSRYEYPVGVWQFGRSLTMIALTGETVVDYALRFKQRYGADTTWVAGYNNDLLAYVPSLRVLKEGGYEGTEGIYEYGWPAPFSASIEESIAEAVDDLVRRTAGK